MIKECFQNRFGNGLCQTHYDRDRRNIDLITWKELFAFDNPLRGHTAKIPLTKGQHTIVQNYSSEEGESGRESIWTISSWQELHKGNDTHREGRRIKSSVEVAHFIH